MTLNLSLWQTELPRPHNAIMATLSNGKPYYEIEMQQKEHTFHPDAPNVAVWCYVDRNSGDPTTYLGPTIEASQDTELLVYWINQLPSNDLFPFNMDMSHVVGSSGHGHHSMPQPGHAVVHLHGAHCLASSDGYPEDYLHPYNPNTPAHGDHIQKCLYSNKQNGSTLWYHDHTMGITRLNVYAGLAGLYILRNENESELGLPAGDFEVPLVIQDRTFIDQEGSVKMHYEVSSDQPEFFGDTAVVNGAVWPCFCVEKRRYRFRVVNGSNSRFYRLRFKSLTENNDTHYPIAHQIGSDGGFLAAPVPLLDTTPLVIAPGERADIIIDFSECVEESEFLLENDAPTPFSANEQLSAGDRMRNIVKFTIKPLVGVDNSTQIAELKLPSNFNVSIARSAIPLKNLSQVQQALAQAELAKIKTRQMTLVETKRIADEPTNDPTATPQRDKEVPDKVLLNNLQFSDPVTETPYLDAIEIWEIKNDTADVHPIHVHLVQFLVLDRDGNAANVAANEAGWKDTVRCHPNEVTRIIMRFTDYVGRYVWHCHMLEHEDHDMMRPFVVQS